MLALAFVLLWAGVALLIDAFASRHPSRRPLAERLAPYQPPVSLADEAEHWLRDQP